MILWEVKKIVKSKIGFFVLAVFIFLCSVMSVIPTIEGENSYRNDKYELVEDPRPVQEIEEVNFNEKVELMEKVANTYVSDDHLKKIVEVSRDNLRFMQYREYVNVDFYKVLNSKLSHPAMSIVLVIIIMLLFTNIYVDEKVAGVDTILLSAKNKYWALYAKLILAVLVPVIMYLTYAGIEYIVTLYQYGPPPVGNLEAFRIVKNEIFLKQTFTIQEYLLLKLGTMLLIFVSIAVFASFFSFISANSLTAISGTMVFILLGKVCTLFNFLPDNILILASIGNYVELMLHPDGFIGMYLGTIPLLDGGIDVTTMCNGILIAMLLVGLAFCAVVFRKFLTR